MATVTVSPTPNPDAMKFTLDRRLDAMFNVPSADKAESDFAKAVFATAGVASLFGTADFVTVTRVPGSDWEPIVAAVTAAAEAHL